MMDNRNRFLSDEVLNKALKVLGIVLLFLAVVFMASQFSDVWVKISSAVSAVLVPVSLAWLISLVVYPLIRLLERRGVGPRGLSLAIVYLFIAVLLFAIGYVGIPFITDQIRTFFEVEVPKLTAYFQGDFKDNFILGPEVYAFLENTIEESRAIEDTIAGIIGYLTGSLSSTLLGLVTIILILPIMLIFYLKDYELINDSLRSLVPQRYEKSASELGTRFNQTVGAYVRGQLLLMFAIGAAATAAYKFIGLDYFLVFGIIVGITNIIPYFGAIIAMVPVVTFAIITRGGQFWMLVFLVNIILQFIEGNIFQPVIMGRALEIHPLIIIVSILFFGSLFGTLGVIFASPIAATIRVLIDFYKERQALRAEKNAQGPPVVHET